MTREEGRLELVRVAKEMIHEEYCRQKEMELATFYHIMDKARKDDASVAEVAEMLKELPQVTKYPTAEVVIETAKKLVDFVCRESNRG